MFNLSHRKLIQSQRNVFSQGGQDGVLEAIFGQIKPRTKFFIDFGARDGIEISNTANLRANHGWYGLLMDAYPLSKEVHKERITAENINYLFDKYKVVAIEPDLLCIDIDGIDYFVWEAIKLSPMVVVIEYNSKFKNNESYTIQYNPDHIWDGDDYYGASLLALKKLGAKKGYTLVHVVAELDAIFIRNDLLDAKYSPPSTHELLPFPIIAHDKVSLKNWVKI